MTPASDTAKKSFSDSIEENLIAGILGAMTVVTFANVIARYVYNSNLLWALETTVFLFAWLVLIGASYCVKHNLHLGVDVVLVALPKKAQKICSLLAVFACIVFSVLVLYGSWTYWLPFATERIWYEVDDIPMPDFLQVFADSLNEGERWEKLPRFIPYTCLPLGFGLLLFRFLQVAKRIMNDEQKLIIAAHEVAEKEGDTN